MDTLDAPKSRTVDVGDLILVDRRARSITERIHVNVPEKLLPVFHGPYQVAAVKGSTVFYHSARGPLLDVHMNDVRPFHPPPNFSLEAAQPVGDEAEEGEEGEEVIVGDAVFVKGICMGKKREPL